MTLNILGTQYRVETHKVSEDKTLQKYNWQGYCDYVYKLIVVADFAESSIFDYENYKERKTVYQQTLRHEIIHAFLNESGLRDCSSSTNSWATNEEMIDWLANQSPKIIKAFREVGAM